MPPSGVKLSWAGSPPRRSTSPSSRRRTRRRRRCRSGPPCPPCCRPPWLAEMDWSTPWRVSCGLPFCSKNPAMNAADEPQRGHHGEDHSALALAAHHHAVGDREGEPDHQQGEDLEQVREPGRVLERVRRVGVQRAAAVGAELLDRLLAGERATRDLLLPSPGVSPCRRWRRCVATCTVWSTVRRGGVREVLDRALAHQHDRR